MNKELLSILEIVKQNPTGTADKIAEKFGITRQSASRKLKGLCENNLVQLSGRGRSSTYSLVEKVIKETFEITKETDEFLVFSQLLFPMIKHLNSNVVEVLQYGFTEMFNNAIDHSEGSQISVEIRQTPLSTMVSIEDNGLGIFEKIQKAFDLVDIRQSIFELSKGKLTTDSQNHSGEGIFFSSKIFDFFVINSKGWAFVHNGNVIDIMYEHDVEYVEGTKVSFEFSHDNTIRIKEVFDKFAMPDEYAFAMTVVQLSLAKHEGEFLISRSQAKRIVARFDRFQKVILDFQGVTSIGQGFADQLFRVYQNEHPNVEFIPINANTDVQDMIVRSIRSN